MLLKNYKAQWYRGGGWSTLETDTEKKMLARHASTSMHLRTTIEKDILIFFYLVHATII